MTVIDSSIVVDLLTNDDEPTDSVSLMLQGLGPVAPDILPFEVFSAVRRLVQRKRIAVERGPEALSDLRAMGIELFATAPRLDRAWGLRHNFGAGDAFFVALAIELQEPLVTTDARLGAAAAQIGLEVLVPSAPSP